MLVTLGLIGGCERVHVACLRPGHRKHLHRRVELHGTAAKHDGTVVQRQICGYFGGLFLFLIDGMEKKIYVRCDKYKNNWNQEGSKH